ncbi:MAG: fluoride efflux transporter CrcB [Ignavibacteria bacterium]|nr:MAG: fluoride efflux transporter CrcB [Ignavibacteria bacterium]
MLLAVAAGGGIGAGFRYLFSGAVYSWTGEDFPYGTLVVNVVGSLILGFLVQIAETKAGPGPLLKVFLTVGLCGGFTTFSTFSVETWRLMADGSYISAGLNAAGSVVLCLIGVYAGILLARLV